MWVAKQFLVAIDFHSMEENTMEVNGYQQCSKSEWIKGVNNDKIFVLGGNRFG